MKATILKGSLFVSKSLLWSALLYIVCMLAINWDEVLNASYNGEAGLQVYNKVLLPSSPSVSAIPSNAGAALSSGVIAFAGHIFSAMLGHL